MEDDSSVESSSSSCSSSMKEAPNSEVARLPARKKRKARALRKEDTESGSDSDSRSSVSISSAKQTSCSKAKKRKSLKSSSSSDGSERKEVKPSVISGSTRMDQKRKSSDSSGMQNAESDSEKEDDTKCSASKSSDTSSESQAYIAESQNSAPVAKNLNSLERETKSYKSIRESTNPVNEEHAKSSKHSDETSSASVIDNNNDSNKKSTVKKFVRSDACAFRLKKLKKMVVTAGFRLCYKKLFENFDSVKQQIRIVERALRDRGINVLTIEACKNYRLKKEEEKELADLCTNEIIDPESESRVTRGSRKLRDERNNSGRRARLSSSSEADSEVERIREENNQIFSRLKGIVSDESD